MVQVKGLLAKTGNASASTVLKLAMWGYDMIPDGVDELVLLLVEDLEEEVQQKCEEFWAMMEKANLTDEEHNEVLEKLLRAAEYLFSPDPKE